ncbi:hypothetical protein INR49_025402 [Caranx melampygus]|nr:hypothetical protein INR49_025402 [Caranx melampygus]
MMSDRECICRLILPCIPQTFTSLVMKTFSGDCKKMSVEIFERTMPSSVHWRHNHRTAFPSSPSEYASLAAQNVIGQVIEGVAPFSDDARIQALSVTMTAFLEAWMEHILKQKIKFSVQGALQLKQDFDSIRDLIQSDKYGLSADLHQHLLSLRLALGAAQQDWLDLRIHGNSRRWRLPGLQCLSNYSAAG